MKIGKSEKISKKDKLLLNSFSDTPSDLVFWSFRYFLGRMTIATCCFARDLANSWPYLDERVKELIKRELETEFERDDKARALRKVAKEEDRYKIYTPLGHDCDRESWELVRKAYTNE